MAERPLGEVLLVEDDDTLGAIVARHLTAHGFATEIAGSTEEAERRLAAGFRPGLILLDINLPGETGWSLVRGRAFADAGRPPVIVVSATRIPSSRLRSYAVAGYLPKPFAMETLLETVRRHVAQGASDGAGVVREPVEMEIP